MLKKKIGKTEKQEDAGGFGKSRDPDVSPAQHQEGLL